MSDSNRGFARSIPVDRADMSVDAGLRAFMLGVYNKMTLGLLLSAAMGFLTSQVAPVRDLMFRVTADGRLAGLTGIGLVIGLAPIAIILFSGFAIRNQTPRSAGVTYWSIVTLMGASLGLWALLYTGASIAITFLITASAFGSLSLFGYATKRDLSGVGSFMIMGLWGLIIASLVNAFLHLPALAFAVNILGVLIFAGLTAWNTQQLKLTYYQLGGDQAAMSVATSYGALRLYLDFINMFQFLLSLLGNRR
ncbi:MAG: Bax inhibitor-1/YccA family protein [Phenylobacterium sp.]|nr:MAG: Bax inhibitor-1/YccA family protein [Phenylobacterium sp.]